MSLIPPVGAIFKSFDRSAFSFSCCICAVKVTLITSPVVLKIFPSLDNTSVFDDSHTIVKLPIDVGNFKSLVTLSTSTSSKILLKRNSKSNSVELSQPTKANSMKNAIIKAKNFFMNNSPYIYLFVSVLLISSKLEYVVLQFGYLSQA